VTQSSINLERVLACPKLPTLPGVAVKVLELTRDPQVSLTKLAQTVQNDPALATKVLKTINSSYYGLTVPCPSISRAMTLLGLSTVKSLVLGFSLVETTGKIKLDDRFDLVAHWRRAVYSAAAARALALEIRVCDPDEAFLGGLVQDIGLLACFAALRDEFAAVMQAAPTDHDELPSFERTTIGFDHAAVGEQLAQRWRLPPQLVESIGKHHRPESADPSHQSLVRVVAAGTMAAAALTAENPKPKLGRYIVSCREWFSLSTEAARGLLAEAARGAAELSKLLNVRTGAAPDVAAIQAQAHEQLLVAQEEMQRETVELRKSNTELSRKTITDALTGAFNRAHFDEQLAHLAAQARSQGSPLALIMADADRFKSVNDTHGHPTGDAVLRQLVARLTQALGTVGVVCRLGGEEFAVLVPGASLDKAVKLAELARTCVGRAPLDVRGSGAKVATLPVTVSLGVATIEPGPLGHESPDALVKAADAALYAAKQNGRNQVRSHAANAAPANGGKGPVHVLVVEDDPLATRLLQMLFERSAGLKASFTSSAEAALEFLAKPENPKPNVILMDYRLPGMNAAEFITRVKSSASAFKHSSIVISTSADPSVKSASLAAGASAFVDKSEFVTNFDAWVSVIEKLAVGKAAA
jgi:diguanylate cyclase (GGDEF)-like protein